MRIAMVVGGILIGALVVGALVVDEGEVVTLTTRAADGTFYETQLWIVEHEDALYLRASSPEATWLQRIQHDPAVLLEREDGQQKALATPLPSDELRDTINQAMARKYGAAERFWCYFRDSSQTVPIRLDPAEQAETSPGPGPTP